MRFKYTPEMLEFLERGYQHMSCPLLTQVFNKRFNQDKTAQQIKCLLHRKGVTSGRKQGVHVGYSSLFTIEQIRFIKRAYPKMIARSVCREMNRWFGTNFKPGQVVTFVHNHGIDSGRTGQFKKGRVPANKGKKMPPGWAPGRMAETQFKKGSMPVSTAPIDTEVLDRDGYRKIKISEGGKPGESRFNWKYLHRKVWEDHHGPVPDGHAVAFKDGDKQNCDIHNLILVSRAELAYLNKTGLNEAPSELRETALLVAKAEAKRFSLRRENNE